jgi:cytochrome c biogenesis protein CcmG, thiol:disulfide interchange protein DsbE
VKSSVNVWVGLLLVAAAVLVWSLAKPKEHTLGEVHLVPLAAASGTPDHDISIADLRGKVALLNFWGTWCPPCREEFPHIVELYHKWGRSQGVAVLAVSCSGGNDAGDLKSLRDETAAFLAAKKADLPIYFDPGGRTRQAVRETVGFRGYPTTIVLDRSGKIRGTWVGYSSGRELEMDQLIQQLVREPVVREPAS